MAGQIEEEVRNHDEAEMHRSNGGGVLIADGYAKFAVILATFAEPHYGRGGHAMEISPARVPARALIRIERPVSIA
jgi:hypothetical protein